MVSKPAWECEQAMCALSCQNKLLLLWVPGHSGIQGNDVAVALVREGSSIDHKPAIIVSPCVGWVEVYERHSEDQGASPSMRQSKVVIERPSGELPRDVLALDKKQYR
jgi:hypothetical protein